MLVGAIFALFALFRVLEGRCELPRHLAYLDDHFTPMKRVSVRYVVPANDVTPFPADASTVRSPLIIVRRAA